MAKNFTRNTYSLKNAAMLSTLLLGGMIGEAQTTFSNRDTIDIPDGSELPITGKPYPSVINVSKMKGIVSNIRVTLYGVQHNFPDAVDIMLVAPDQSNVILMSDVGSAADVKGINITFDDDAMNELPDRATITAGIYKPTNAGTDMDVWPPNAPQPSGSTKLSSLYGMDANGKWSLYAVNDIDGSFGVITGGWSITFETVKDNNPVDFNNFAVSYQQQQNTVLLQWETGHEYNTGSFIIERFADNGPWRPIAEIDAAGFSTDATNYSFVDTDIEDGTYKYRIKMIGKDPRDVKYSGTETVIVKNTNYIAYPNPARSFTYIISDSRVQENVTVKLYDVNNNLIAQKAGVLGGLSTIRLDFNAVNVGPHYLVISNGTKQTVKTLNVVR